MKNRKCSKCGKDLNFVGMQLKARYVICFECVVHELSKVQHLRTSILKKLNGQRKAWIANGKFVDKHSIAIDTLQWVLDKLDETR